MSSEFVVVAQGVEALSPKRLLNRYRYQSWDLASAAARVYLEGPQEPGMGALVLMVREALPEDVEETTLLEFPDHDELSIYTYASKPNGAWDSTPPSGVAIVHRPSGIEVRCHSMRSAYANRNAAYCELQVRLHGWTRPEQAAGSDDAPAPIGDPDQLQVVGRQCFPQAAMRALPHYRQQPWVDGDIHQQPSEPDLYSVEPLVKLSDVRKLVDQMVMAGAPSQPASMIEHLQRQVAAFQDALLCDAQCKECGSMALSWDTHIKTDTGIQQGRLNTRDVKCLLVLGCDECSATVATVSADTLANRLNTLRGEQ